MKKIILIIILSLIKAQNEQIPENDEIDETKLPKRDKEFVELEDLRIQTPILEGSKIKRKIVRIYNRRRMGCK